jgi:two-component system, sensor histidine kinase ChiS
MNVLIVEDNPISSTVLEHTLDKHGYETITTHDGEEALTCLESHPEIELVITDIVMPNADGVELVRRIKERDEWNEIPILVCTSLRPETIHQRLAGQGWKYLIKPIRANSLMQKVTEAFAQKRQILQEPELTMSQIGIDPKAFAEVLDKFSQLVSNSIVRVEQQVAAAQEPIDLKDLLEGAKLIRAERLSDLLTSLEQCPNGRKLELFRSKCPLLLRELKALQYP